MGGRSVRTAWLAAVVMGFLASAGQASNPASAALLIVSAAEGIKPQTVEHLQIIDLLGLDRGVVALTKADLADDDQLLERMAEVETLLAATSLKGADIVPVSALSGRGWFANFSSRVSRCRRWARPPVLRWHCYRFRSWHGSARQEYRASVTCASTGLSSRLPRRQRS